MSKKITFLSAVISQTVGMAIFMLLALFSHVANAQTTDTYTAIYNLMQAKCSTCHSPTTLAGGLNLSGTQADVYNAIVGQSPNNVAAAQKGQKLIDKGHPYNSFMLRKVNNGLMHQWDGGQLSTDEGAAMPQYATPLTNIEFEMIRQWIYAGAPQTGDVVPMPLITSYYTEGGYQSVTRPEPPAPGTGFQIHLGPIFVTPGDEKEYDIKYDLQLNEPIEVTRLDCHMDDQSHHFLLYKYNQDPQDVAEGLRLITLGGTAVSSLFNTYDRPLVAAWQDSDDMQLPAGTAFKWDTGTTLDLNYHLPNYGTAILPANMYLNVYTQPNGTALKEMKTGLLYYDGPIPAWVNDLSGDELSELLYPIAESFVSTAPDQLEQQLQDQGWPQLLIDGVVNLVEGGVSGSGLADFIGNTLATLLDLGVVQLSDINIATYNLMLAPNADNQVFENNYINGPQWNIWYITSHTHKYGSDYDVYALDENGNPSIQLFEGTQNGVYDWSHPPVLNIEPLYELPAGRGIRHRGVYNNTSSNYITFGLTTNEEMMLTFIQYTEGENIPFVGVPNLQNTYCLDAQPLTFQPEGGTLTGNGTQNGQFSPALAGVGTHSVTYTYLYNGQPITASYNISVIEPQAPTITYDAEILTAPPGYDTYQWYFNNGLPIPDATGTLYQPTASGSYYVIATVGGCAVQSNTIQLVVDGIATIADNILLKAYPNPYTEQTTIAYALPQAADVKIDLYNLMGQKVAHLFEGKEAGGLHIHRLDARLLNLSSGIYFAHVSVDGQVGVVKIIQQ